MTADPPETREPYHYVDASGHTVTVYPPGYAEGAEPSDFVKPTGRRGVRETALARD